MIVEISGRLVIGKDIDRLESIVQKSLEQNVSRFIFDLSPLDYADSAGMAAFVSCLTRIRKAQGELRLAGANPRIQHLFQITGVAQLMSIFPSVADAVAAS